MPKPDVAQTSARLDVTRVNTPRNIEETDRFKDKVLGGQGVASDKPCDGQSPGKEGAAVLIQLSTKKQDKVVDCEEDSA